MVMLLKKNISLNFCSITTKSLANILRMNGIVVLNF